MKLSEANVDKEQIVKNSMTVQKMYIDGVWVESTSKKTRKVVNPANNEVIAIVTEGSIEDVDAAVTAAKRAFYLDGWMNSLGNERANLLEKLADKVEEQLEEFAYLETLNNGKPLREARFNILNTIATLRYNASLINKPLGQTYTVNDQVQSLVVREPIGVCGLIAPWNFPLQMAAWKIAPALAAGNTIVFKPSEITPLTVIKLFELIEEVGFPKGVANLVLGSGAIVGAAIANHKDVEKISFTGGTTTGQSIMQAASTNIKNLSLELGGKSPIVVFEDSDIDTVVDIALYAIFFGQGQVCTAGSRLVVHASLHDAIVEKLAERANKIRVGPGLEDGVEMGPLITPEHLNKVLNYIDVAQKEGARLVCGGYRLTGEKFDKGNFLAPTIFTDTTPNMRIIQEEVFGPVLAIQVFETEEEAIELANNCDFGLAAAVFSTDGARAQRVIRQLRAGITWINSYHTPFIEAPWGGYKQSGIGRELGIYGFESFTEIKQINIPLSVDKINWFEN